jgi:hypothetical protein
MLNQYKYNYVHPDNINREEGESMGEQHSNTHTHHKNPKKTQSHEKKKAK